MHPITLPGLDVIAYILDPEEKFCFYTNNFFLFAEQTKFLYKNRWQAGSFLQNGSNSTLESPHSGVIPRHPSEYKFMRLYALYCVVAIIGT